MDNFRHRAKKLSNLFLMSFIIGTLVLTRNSNSTVVLTRKRTLVLTRNSNNFIDTQPVNMQKKYTFSTKKMKILNMLLTVSSFVITVTLIAMDIYNSSQKVEPKDRISSTITYSLLAGGILIAGTRFYVSHSLKNREKIEQIEKLVRAGKVKR